MKNILTVLSLLFFSTVFAQHRVVKITLSSTNNFYSYGEEAGEMNSGLRYGSGILLRYKSYDSAKRNGMIYEIATFSTSGYYKAGNNALLQVKDYHANINIIFPVLIVKSGGLEHCLGAGITVGTLAARDYLDESNNLLPYNNTTLKKLKFGNYWTGALLLDYEFDFKLSRRIGFSTGIRFFTSVPFNPNSDYEITQGTGIMLKYGMFFQLK